MPVRRARPEDGARINSEVVSDGRRALALADLNTDGVVGGDAHHNDKRT